MQAFILMAQKKLVDCEKCINTSAVLKRPKNGAALCKPCFFVVFEQEIHETIVNFHLFERGDRVAIGASGGKDSTVLAHVLKLLNDRFDYGIELVLLSIDEGITGYRDDSLQAVKRNSSQYDLRLEIVSYRDLYGWTMDEIVRKIGLKNNCTFCGVFRRQALDRGACKIGVDKIATGHNADDIAETILMNILRGDISRLQRCTNIVTEHEAMLPRCKPLKHTYEKEIVMYSHFKKLDYFSTECIYAPNAYRGHIRAFVKDLERVRPRVILDLIRSGEALNAKESVRLPSISRCVRCAYISSQTVCKACVLLQGLNTNQPLLGIRKSSKVNLSEKSSASSCGNGGSCTCDSEQNTNLDF